MKKIRPPSLVVFDMDGVIIDVSGSYRETVRQTARRFFAGARSWEDLPDPLFPLSDLAAVKQGGGLNNDWDLTAFVIALLFKRVKAPPAVNDPDPWSRYSRMIAQCDVTELARYLKSTPYPLTALQKKTDSKDKKVVTRFYGGDVGSGNIIKHIFQELYLGTTLFKATYGIASKTDHAEGYIKNERLLIDRSTLKRLAKHNVLAIATGRPRAEADYPLNSLDLAAFFTTVYALDDCLREERRIRKVEGQNISLSKPHPFMLDAIAETLNRDFGGYYYLGDMPDDMLAAKRSRTGFKGIGVLLSAPDRAHLKKNLLSAGADFIIDDFSDLIRILGPEIG